jgi:hypothetical protein
MNTPWLKFYPADWRADPALRMCSLAARGLWMEMLCIMHEAEPRGNLLVNGRAVEARQLASLAGVGEAEASALLAELGAAGVFSRRRTGVVYSRRMERDEQKARKNKENGRMGGNPTLCGQREKQQSVNRQDKAQKPEARSQRPEGDGSFCGEEQRSTPRATPPKPSKAHLIPDDFALTADRRSRAIIKGLSHDRVDWEFDKFRGYWMQSDRPNARKRNWDAAWDTWVMRAVEGGGLGYSGSQPRGNGRTPDSRLRATQRAADRFGVFDAAPKRWPN